MHRRHHIQSWVAINVSAEMNFPMTERELSADLDAHTSPLLEEPKSKMARRSPMQRLQCLRMLPLSMAPPLRQEEVSAMCIQSLLTRPLP